MINRKVRKDHKVKRFGFGELAAKSAKGAKRIRFYRGNPPVVALLNHFQDWSKRSYDDIAFQLRRVSYSVALCVIVEVSKNIPAVA